MELHGAEWLPNRVAPTQYVHCWRNVCVKVDVDRSAFGLRFLLAVALLSHSLWRERPEVDCTAVVVSTQVPSFG